MRIVEPPKLEEKVFKKIRAWRRAKQGERGGSPVEVGFDSDGCPERCRREKVSLGRGHQQSPAFRKKYKRLPSKFGNYGAEDRVLCVGLCRGGGGGFFFVWCVVWGGLVWGCGHLVCKRARVAGHFTSGGEGPVKSATLPDSCESQSGKGMTSEF